LIKEDGFDIPIDIALIGVKGGFWAATLELPEGVTQIEPDTPIKLNVQLNKMAAQIPVCGLFADRKGRAVRVDIDLEADTYIIPQVNFDPEAPQLGLARVDEHYRYGLCPTCHGEGPLYTVRTGLWLVCEAHSLKWYLGPPWWSEAQ